MQRSLNQTVERRQKRRQKTRVKASKNRGLPNDGHLLTWKISSLFSMESLFSTSVRKPSLKKKVEKDFSNH